ncbi:MAG: aminotransferase class I/II-fold pyridoxal phosphate-dependent enzyme, partial [Campylobacterota bacterium]
NALDTKIDKNSLVVFVNPATPDGVYYKMRPLLQRWQESNATVIVDESFLEFCNKQSTIKYLKKIKNLYILKSLTKFYACAGVRVGVVLSRGKNIKALMQKQPPWQVGAYDSAYIIKALSDKKFAQKSDRKNKKAKKRLHKTLQHSKHIATIYPSVANFFLVKLATLDAKSFTAKLAKHNIMVRNCENFDGLDASYVRIAIKDKAATKALQRALRCL